MGCPAPGPGKVLLLPLCVLHQQQQTTRQKKNGPENASQEIDQIIPDGVSTIDDVNRRRCYKFSDDRAVLTVFITCLFLRLHCTKCDPYASAPHFFFRVCYLYERIVQKRFFLSLYATVQSLMAQKLTALAKQRMHIWQAFSFNCRIDHFYIPFSLFVVVAFNKVYLCP